MSSSVFICVCWGRNTGLYQKTAGNLQHKILLLCTHANRFQKQSKLVQQLLNCYITANEKGGIRHKLQAKSDIQGLNLENQVRKCHTQEKSPVHSPAANVATWKVNVWRDASAEAKHNRRSQKDDTRGHSNEQVAECALAGRLWSTGGLSALISILQLSLAPARVKERSSSQPDAGRETTAHKRAEDCLSGWSILR